MDTHPTDPHRTQRPGMTIRTLIRSRSDAPHRSAQPARRRRRVAAAVAAVAVAGAAYTTAEAATPNRQPNTPNTPNQCIRLNHGDYNACNVGNSGRGDLPYHRVAYTPDDCIRAQRRDENAWNDRAS